MPEIQLNLNFVEYASAQVNQEELDEVDNPELFKKLLAEQTNELSNRKINYVMP
jgi:ABC-type oligopeptide transport system substrate-binding subunit